MAEIEFWYEFGSTYSYPAAMRIERLAADAGVALRWRPFLLGPIFKAYGWNDSPFNIFAAKGRYMWRDIERICEEAEIPLLLPAQFLGVAEESGLIVALDWWVLETTCRNLLRWQRRFPAHARLSAASSVVLYTVRLGNATWR